MLNCLRKLSLCVDFGILGHISCALQLIKCSPNLSELEISVKGTNDNVDAFLKCLKTPGFLQLPLNKLEYVSFYGFANPMCVLFFAMIFLSHAPSLLRIYIEQPIHIDSSNIAIELSRLPRASPKAEVVCDLIS